MNILWFGSVPRADIVANHHAVNEASRKWQTGLLDALMEEGASVTTVAHRYEQCWPKGLLFPGKNEEFPQRYNNRLVRFFNAPVVRFASLKFGYYRQGVAAMESGEYDVLIIYNPYPWHVWAAKRLSSRYHIPWVCLTLDHDDVGGDGWDIYKKETQGASGHVFVSHWGAENSPFPSTTLHLDAGCRVEDIQSGLLCEKPEVIHYLYAGGLSASAGFDFLVEAVKFLPERGVQIDVCGKFTEEIRRKVQGDSRFKLHGFVTEQMLERITSEAHVLLNPRPPDLELNRMVFPSKLMEYMKHTKPIVTTWTAGLHPGYRKYVFAEGTNTPEGFAKQMEIAGRLSYDERQLLSQEIRKYLIDCKQWSLQADTFINFVKRVTQVS